MTFLKKKKKDLQLESFNNNNDKENEEKNGISAFFQLSYKWVDKKPSTVIHKCISRLHHFFNFPDALLAVLFFFPPIVAP